DELRDPAPADVRLRQGPGVRELAPQESHAGHATPRGGRARRSHRLFWCPVSAEMLCIAQILHTCRRPSAPTRALPCPRRTMTTPQTVRATSAVIVLAAGSCPRMNITAPKMQ